MLRWLPLALITLVALWLRTHELTRRPMHADEANQAVKLGSLLETGHYAFDPRDHHGPTLYYAALPIAWVRGEKNLASLSETSVRLVPAFAGSLSVLLLAAAAMPLGRWPALASAAFLAISPPAVYFSRYFIQETLLATCILAVVVSVQRWLRTGATRWAIAAGFCAGLAQATKASAPLFLVIAALAWSLARLVKSPSSAVVLPTAAPLPAPGPTPRCQLYPGRALLLAGSVGLGTAALLYSSFLTHPTGLVDALGAYSQALTRFGATAAPTGHEKAWGYYLRIFGWFRSGGLVWHQLVFTVLALAGILITLLRRDRWCFGVAVYTVTIFAVFSGFAYKTPWHLIHFVPGLAVLAALALARLAQQPRGGLFATGAALLVGGTLWQQTWLTSFLRPADQRNPYAYVHSSADVLKYRALAEAAVARSPLAPIRVISEEYWPLPWYLRTLPQVGFWSQSPPDANGSLVITSPAQLAAVRASLHGPYRESILGLRPGVFCIVLTPDP